MSGEISGGIARLSGKRPLSQEFACDGLRILMIHASPWEPYEEYIYPGSKRLDEFASLPYDMVCFGHTHVPLVHQAGAVVVINPGSCSQPRDREPARRLCAV